MDRSRPLLFIPTYNEHENVERLFREIAELPLDLDVLFMDDASPDGTGEILDRLAAGTARVTVVHRPSKRGIGSAHRDGIRYAYRHGYRTLITMDSDLTHPTKRIPEFAAHALTHDVVLGSRFVRKESLAGWDPVRTFLTHLGHFLTRTLLKVPYDATGGFRVYRLDRIDPRVFELVRSDGYAFLFESLFQLCRYGVAVKELPIDLPKRTYGHSKMRVSDVFASVRRLVALWIGSFRTAGQVRSLRAARAELLTADPASAEDP